MTLPYCRRAQAIHVAHTHQISQTLKRFTFYVKWKLIIFTGLLENVFVRYIVRLFVGFTYDIYAQLVCWAVYIDESDAVWSPTCHTFSWLLCGTPLFNLYYNSPISYVVSSSRVIYICPILSLSLSLTLLRGTLPCRLVVETWEHIVLWVLLQIDLFWIFEFITTIFCSI